MYKIVGGDRKEYGPVPLDAVRQWIIQGRANAKTLASYEGGPWMPLESFPELSQDLRASSPPPLANYPGAMPTAEANKMAVTGLVFGILGLFCCPPLTPLLAIVFSCIGLVQITGRPGQYTTSRTIPIVGICLGIVGIVVTVILYRSGVVERMLQEMQR